MTSLADLHRTVRATIATKRIGTPVFVRYLAHGALDAEPRPGLYALAQLTGLVSEWLGQPVERVMPLFSQQDGKGQTTLTLQFPQGGRVWSVRFTANREAGAST